MIKLVITIALAMLVLPGFAQSRNCLRVMPVDELTRTATWIGRVKVFKTEKAQYRGMYNQVAMLRPVDVIEGDFTLKELPVLARANVRCAEDNYTEKLEMLVFLEPKESLFHTRNYQYGQFLVVGEIVKGWRDKDNKPIDKPYAEVRREIEAYLNAMNKPPSEQTIPQQTVPPKPDPLIPAF